MGCEFDYDHGPIDMFYFMLWCFFVFGIIALALVFCGFATPNDLDINPEGIRHIEKPPTTIGGRP